MRILLLILMTLNLEAAEAGWNSKPIIVSTQQGKVEGQLNNRGTGIFKGIPYAEPPIGRLRWRAPQRPRIRSGILRVNRAGNICLQPSFITRRIVGSEDCLYLNIWTPSPGTSERLPVMVWLHGGAFIIGDGIQRAGLVSLYEGTRLAEAGKVVVVTLNYRLGPMGFMANSQLAQEDPNGSSGNYGILDQIAALKWVQENIKYFGGDPERVTIFGESAGGASVLTHLASPLSKGLFAGAISQSGPLMDLSFEMANIQGQRVISKYGDSRGRISMDRLREVSGARIVRDFPMSWSHDGSKPLTQYGPVVDGYVLKRSILETLQRGEGSNVPLIIGSNRDEMTVLAPMFMGDVSRRMTDEEYHNLVSYFHGPSSTERIVQIYNRDKQGSNWQALMDLMTDSQFHSPAQLVANAMEQSNPASTFLYIFSQEVNLFKAGHATEIPYIFQNPTLLQMFSHRPFLPLHSLVNYADQVKLSYLMMRMWTRFAHAGNPNGSDSGDLYWPDGSDGKVMHFESRNTHVIDEFKANEVEFWSDVGCEGILKKRAS